MPPSTRVPNFFTQMVELAQEQRTSPFMGRINLAGAGGAGGGSGTPPGGVLGQLRQTLVAYDTSESANASTGSAPSLLDNLNHVRGRLAALEAGSGGSVGGGGGGTIDFGQTEYSGVDLSLGVADDSAFTDVDAAHAVITITPSSLGTYQATCTFSRKLTWNSDADYRGTTQFRLWDGSVAVATIEKVYDTPSGGEVVSLSGLFTWSTTTPKTVKLQKKNNNYSAITLASNVILVSGGNALHLDVFRLGSTGISLDEAYERTWWGW